MHMNELALDYDAHEQREVMIQVSGSTTYSVVAMLRKIMTRICVSSSMY